MKNSTRRRIKYYNYMKNRLDNIMAQRKFKIWHKKRNHTNDDDDDSDAYANKIVEFLSAKNFKVKCKNKRKKTIVIPKVFSFIKNPNETIQILKEIVACGLDKKTRRLHFDHSCCEDLEICASTIMDVIILAIRNKRRRKSPKLKLSGTSGENAKIVEILTASGLLKHLNIQTNNKIKNNIEKLELVRKGDSGVVGTKVAEYFLRCLKTQRVSLTNHGKDKMSIMVAEVLNNCKLHSGGLQEWFTLGHYSKSLDGNSGECRLVIFDFGDTIYESFSSAESVPEAYKKIMSATDYKKPFLSGAQSKESLVTLIALQEGVSRFKEESNDRGTGTIKLIESFQSIGKDKSGNVPLMSITSGKTQILFDGRYKLKVETSGGDRKQIIAFNEENDLRKLPDKDNVKDLQEFFPGTVISMRFFLDREYLIACIGQGGHNGNEIR